MAKWQDIAQFLLSLQKNQRSLWLSSVFDNEEDTIHYRLDRLGNDGSGTDNA